MFVVAMDARSVVNCVRQCVESLRVSVYHRIARGTISAALERAKETELHNPAQTLNSFKERFDNEQLAWIGLMLVARLSALSTNKQQ